MPMLMVQYLVAFVVCAAIIIGGKLLIWLFDTLTNKKKSSVHAKVIQRLDNHFMVVAVVLGVYFGLTIAHSWNFFVVAMFKSIVAIITFTTLSLVLQAYAHEWMKHLIETHHFEMNTQNVSVFRKFLRVVMCTLCIIALLWIWRVNPAQVVSAFDFMNTHALLRTTLIFVVYLVLAKAVVLLCKRYLQGMLRLKGDQEGLVDSILDQIETAASWMIVFYGLYFSMQLLGYTATIILPLIATAILFIAMHMVVMIVDTFLINIEHTIGQEVSLLPTIHNLVKVVVIFFGFLLIFGIWGVNTLWIAGVFGILIIVLGFVFRDALSPAALGVSLLSDATIKPGKAITLETGEKGIVEDVSFRSTTLRTKHGILVVPHSRLAYMKITCANTMNKKKKK